MRSVANVSAALGGLGALAVLAGCGFGFLAKGTECAPVATRVGVALDIEPPFAAKVADAEMKVCWDGRCRSPELDLFDSTTSEPLPCPTGDTARDDASCGARAVPTGGKHTFADIPDLPDRPVQVTVVLRDGDGEAVVDEQLTVTPKRASATGNQCNDDGVYSRLVVEQGQVGVRT